MGPFKLEEEEQANQESSPAATVFFGYCIHCNAVGEMGPFPIGGQGLGVAYPAPPPPELVPKGKISLNGKGETTDVNFEGME